MSVRYRLFRFARGVSQWPLVKALVPRGLKARVNWLLGRSVMNEFPDRRYLEDVVLPTLAALRPGQLLDVGLESYTAHHGSFFGPETDRWTLDLNPEVARHGVPGRHLVANVLDAGRHFAPGSLDAVTMNGPFGFGLDRLDEQVRALEVVHGLLRPGGWLLIGWNRTSEGELLIAATPPPPAGTAAREPGTLDVVRERFEHVGPSGLPARKTFDGSSHVYDWYRAR